MTANPQQEAIIASLHDSINVSAGAGTGKTYTLTQRTIHALEDMIERHAYSDAPIEHVLAITFTTKAAAELRSRIRSELLRISQDTSGPLLESALAVDDAWISTIHGMASRILRENALEFGIDPQFTVLTQDESDRIMREAFDLVMRERSSLEPLAREMIDSHPVVSDGYGSESIDSMIVSVLARTSLMPDGVDALDFPEPVSTPSDLLRKQRDNALFIRPLFDEEGWSKGEAKKTDAYAEAIDDALALCEAWLDSPSGTMDFLDEGLDFRGLLEAFYAFPATTNAYGNASKPFTNALQAYRDAYQALSSEMEASIGTRRAVGLIQLVKRLQRRISSIKGAEGTRFDDNDLLIICNEKLGLPEHRGILERYRRDFELIMLDEFQDTDRLQMELVGKLARTERATDGSLRRLCNVCTVGDMQQSIYRFRGGDVRETRKRVESLRDGSGSLYELSRNYRTHGAILNAVDAIFSRERAFGDAFLRLEPCCETLDPHMEEVFADRPRVSFDFIHAARASKNTEGITIAEAKRLAAARIAEHLKGLSECGVPLSRMVILLRRLTDADVYARALTAVGMESMIVGGSIFGASPEAQLVEALLAYAVNDMDESALFSLLTSPLFSLSDDALAALAAEPGVDGPLHRGLARGLADADTGKDLSGADRKSLAHARRTLAGFRTACSKEGAARALRTVLLESGLLFRLSEDGLDASEMAMAGNLSKAIHIVSTLEKETTGIAQLARRYRIHIHTEKEAPGLLASESADFVSIMTVHASKGLEFDHVVVGEMEEIRRGSPTVSVENIGDVSYIAVRPTAADFPDKETRDTCGALRKFTGLSDDLAEEDAIGLEARIASAATPQRLLAAMTAYTDLQEAQEAQRMLYVAMTRARESLYVSHIESSNPTRSDGYKGIFADIHEALIDIFAKDEGGFDPVFSGVQDSVGFHRSYLVREDLTAEQSRIIDSGNGDSDGGGRSFAIPVYPPSPPFDAERFDPLRASFRSYSSLSAHLHDGAERDIPVPQELSEHLGIAGETAPPEGTEEGEEIATDLGTAFHRLAQRAIEEAVLADPHSRALAMPSDRVMRVQADRCGLSDEQLRRLEEAFMRWVNSALAEEFVCHRHLAAEIPFTVQLRALDGPDGERGRAFILEGEIDGLAYNTMDRALLIDYKTGGSVDETSEQLDRKHLLQGQCYAYGLLRQGFHHVDEAFIRVEHEDTADPGEPQLVRYSYSSDDISMLEMAIRDAYGYA